MIVSPSLTYAPISTTTANDPIPQNSGIAAGGALMADPEEVDRALLRLARSNVTFQAAGDLPASADPALLDYQALYARLSSVDPAVLTENQRQFIGLKVHFAEKNNSVALGSGSPQSATAEGISTDQEKSTATSFEDMLVLALSVMYQLGYTATTLRTQAIQARMNEMKEAADSIIKQADSQQKAALAQGVTSMGAGVFQAGMGARSAQMSFKANAATSQANQLRFPEGNNAAAQVRVVNIQSGNGNGVSSTAVSPAPSATQSPLAQNQASTQPNVPSAAASGSQPNGDGQAPISNNGSSPDGKQLTTQDPIEKRIAELELSAKEHTDMATLWTAGMNSTRPLIEGVGTISHGAQTHRAQIYSAEQRMNEATATAADQSINEAQTTSQQTQQSIASALQTLQVVLDSQAKAAQQVYHVS